MKGGGGAGHGPGAGTELRGRSYFHNEKFAVATTVVNKIPKPTPSQSPGTHDHLSAAVPSHAPSASGRAGSRRGVFFVFPAGLPMRPVEFGSG